MSIESSLREKWNDLDPVKRQKLIKIGIVVAGLMVIMLMYSFSGRNEDVEEVVAEDVLEIIDVGESRLEDDIRSQVLRERAEMDQRQHAQERRLTEQRSEIERQDRELMEMRSALDALLKSDLRPNTGDGVSLAGISIPDSERSTDSDVLDEGVEEVDEVTLVGGISRMEIGDAVDRVDEGSEGVTSQKKNDNRFYLPVSFMPARILTGLRAKTVDTAASSPEPILMRVQAPAVLPNDLRKNLEGCLVVAHGYGDLSSERIETKLVSINCLDHSGQLIIEEEIVGIVIDQDGVKGLTASPVSKMGANLARLALAGAISGGAKFASTSSETVSVSPLGQTKSMDPKKIIGNSIGSAVSKAAEEYADIIGDLARQQAPVLEMGAGKDVTIALTEGVWLNIQQHGGQHWEI